MLFNKTKWDYLLTAVAFVFFAYFMADKPVYFWGTILLALIEFILFVLIAFFKKQFQPKWNFLICGVYLLVFSFLIERNSFSEVAVLFCLGLALSGVFLFLHYKEKRLEHKKQ